MVLTSLHALMNFGKGMQRNYQQYMAYYKTRNAGTRNKGTRNSGGTTGYPGTVAEQRNTRGAPPEYQRNTNVTPAEHPGTMEPYKTKNNCSDFKENLNLTLLHLILSAKGRNIFYC